MCSRRVIAAKSRCSARVPRFARDIALLGVILLAGIVVNN